MLLKDHPNYEEFLRKAQKEGWRDPVQITNLEIEAYSAGVRMERNRVLSIFKDILHGNPMRAMDIHSYVNKITKDPNRPL
jgi:hypothetical protein